MDDVAMYTVMISYTVENASEREFWEYGHVLERAWRAWEGIGDNGLGFDSSRRRLTFQSVVVAPEIEAFSLVRRASRELVEVTRAGWPQLTVDTDSFAVSLDRYPVTSA
jgi:hypothetical protein